MGKRKLQDLNLEELEKKRLIKEIGSHNLFRTPAFWTFLAVLGTVLIGWLTGLFESRNALIKLENAKLNSRKHALIVQIDSLEDSFQSQKDSMTTAYNFVQSQYDSVVTELHAVNRTIDSTKEAHRIWEKKKKTKAELIAEVHDLNSGIYKVLSRNRACNDSIRNMIWAAERRLPKWSDLNDKQKQKAQAQADSLWHLEIALKGDCDRMSREEYQVHFEAKALYLRNKMLSLGAEIKEPISLSFYKMNGYWTWIEVPRELALLAEALDEKL